MPSASLHLSRTGRGAVLETAGAVSSLNDDWDALINRQDLAGYLRGIASSGQERECADDRLLAPVGSQEVWAAGVTYERSRSARIDESKAAGGGSFYDRVYEAERPELFFKAAAWRVRGPGESIRVRRDACWSVPEPELALCINARGEIVGYTVANDVSSRDIEGENPLYLPQAKVYDGACALGPSLLVADGPLPDDTTIRMSIARGGEEIFRGVTSLARMRRRPEELVRFLYRETSFPAGAILLTGTGIVPPDTVSLQSGDRVLIEIDGIGVLENPVE